MPNKYLKSKKTTCGTIKALSYKSNYKDFLKNWDFRYLARPKMNAILLYALDNHVPVKRSKRSSAKKRGSTKKRGSKKSSRKSRRPKKKSRK
jgi:hypothetical protein